eukprot:2351587-Prymnesium_polylepis.1
MCDISPPSGDPGKLIAWAEQRLGAGSLASAAACLDAALQLRPIAGHAHYLRGGVLVVGGDSASAVPHFRRAVRLAPAHADAYFELGNAQYGQRDLSGAERSYLAALRTEPGRPLCHVNLANVRSEQGAAAAAERSYRQALTLAPTGFDGCAAANGLGNLLEAAARDREAEHVARRALASTSDCHYASHNLARSLRRRAAHAEAVHHARSALAAAPGQREYKNGLGAALHAAGAHEEAIKAYRDALQSGAGDHMLRLDLANVLHQANRAAESLDAYAAALPQQLSEAAERLPPAPPFSERGEQSRPSRHRGHVVFYCRLRAHAGYSTASEEVRAFVARASATAVLEHLHACAPCNSLLCRFALSAPHHVLSGVGPVDAQQSRAWRLRGSRRLRLSAAGGARLVGHRLRQPATRGYGERRCWGCVASLV